MMGIMVQPPGKQPAGRSLEHVDRLVAAELQRVLLPPTLPRIEGWSVAVLYEPAGEAVLVGGDFYDWFVVPGTDDAVLVVGDVAGKGPVAGAVGMSLRKVLKGITHAVGDPFAAVPIMERALADELTETFASMCLLRIRPASGKVTALLAGHPAPWIRRAGHFRPLTAPPNRLLGIGVGSTDWQTQTVCLDAGDLIFAFTDGLTEATLEDGSLYGEGSLQAFLASLPAQLAAFEVVLQADAALRRIAGAPNDDVIICALGFDSPVRTAAVTGSATGEVRSLRLGPESISARIARRFAIDAGAEWHLPATVTDQVQLVVSELVTNAVLHARTAIQLRLALLDRQIRVEVHDESPTAPDLTAPARSVLADHGRGLTTVQGLTDEIGIEQNERGKAVWATISSVVA